MSQLGVDVAALAPSFPAMYAESGVVHVQLETSRGPINLNILYCDEDTYPAGGIVLICDQDEERAVMCNSAFESKPEVDLRSALLTICQIFEAPVTWNDVREAVGVEQIIKRPRLPLQKEVSGASAYSVESYELSPSACGIQGLVGGGDICTLRGFAMGRKIDSYTSFFDTSIAPAQDVDSHVGAIGTLSSAFPDFSVTEIKSALEAHGYDVDLAAEALLSHFASRHQAENIISSAVSGTAEKFEDTASSTAPSQATSAQTQSGYIGSPQETSKSSQDILATTECSMRVPPAIASEGGFEAVAIRFMVSQTLQGLEKNGEKNRPTTRKAFLNFIQKNTSCRSGGARAFVLDPLEILDTLSAERVITTEACRTLQATLAGYGPAKQHRLAFNACPEKEQERLLREARRGITKMPLAEMARWVVSHSYFKISVPAASVVDALVEGGYIIANSEDKFSVNASCCTPKENCNAFIIFNEHKPPDLTLLNDNTATDSSMPHVAPLYEVPAVGPIIGADRPPLAMERFVDTSGIDRLIAAFPQCSREELLECLERYDGDTNQAAEHLMQVSVVLHEPDHVASLDVVVPGSGGNCDDVGSRLVEQGMDAMSAALGSKASIGELTREAEAVNALRQQLGFLEFHLTTIEPRLENATPELHNEVSLLRRSREEIIAEKIAAEKSLGALRLVLLGDKDDAQVTSGTVNVIVHLDPDRSSQSLRGHGVYEATTQIQRALRASGPWGHYAAYQFAAMLAREQELYNDFVCFYHSYSYAALLYEVQAELARGILKLPNDFAPLPRLDMAPFRVCKSMAALRQRAHAEHGDDHDPAFRAVGLSLSCSLLASGSEAPPLDCFQAGYSCLDLSFRNLLVSVLGGARTVAEELADAVVEVGRKHGLATLGFGRNDRESHPDANVKQLSGYMLQIFVRRSIVEQYAYPSLPYGVPIAGGLLDYVERSSATADGQARLYFDPEVMLDPHNSRLFHYCARPSQSSMDPAVPGSRGSLIRDLRNVLRPLLEGDARVTTAARLGLKPANR